VLIDNNELSGLFGIANLKSNPSLQGYKTEKDYIKLTHVFKTEMWDILVYKFKELTKQNKPLVFQMKLDVLENIYSGTTPYKVDVLFIHQSRNNFLDKLSNDVKNYISNHSSKFMYYLSIYTNLFSSYFYNYPFNNSLKFSVPYVNLTKQNAAYDVISNSEIFNNFIN